MMADKMKTEADKLLYDYGLIDKLNEYGKTHIVGSYSMDLMKFVFDHFSPKWFEGKQDVMAGKRCFFIGFETEVLGEIWNVDIWFFDKTEIANCEDDIQVICEKIKKNEALRNIIIAMKKDLISLGTYGSQYTSVDVYDAVLNCGIYSVEDFVERYKKEASKSVYGEKDS